MGSEERTGRDYRRMRWDREEDYGRFEQEERESHHSGCERAEFLLT